VLLKAFGPPAVIGPLYEATARASARLGREIQVTIRKPGWLIAGSGTFHDTVTSRPVVAVPIER
jgi:hypothetical protein